jgi:hypothetical protein
VRGSATAQRAEHDAYQCGREYDSAHSNQAGFHCGLAQLQLVRAASGGGVLNRPPHEGKPQTATETLRIVVARFVNSVLILASIDMAPS